MLDDFVALSEALTGFDSYALRGTGQAQPYLDTAVRATGEDCVAALLAAWRAASEEAAGDAEALSRNLRLGLLGDPRLGPVARNIIKMWFVGTWYQMPVEWLQDCGRPIEGEGSFVVSPEAYTEGLLWPAVGGNPSGAKPFGYGTWAFKPRVMAS